MLKGAVFFMADLMRAITVPCEIDFMAISSYGASTDSSGVVRILKDLDINIEGRHVLVVEDIVDSGLTLSYLVRNLESREPASLEVCAADQARAARDRRRRPLRRLRDPEPVRDRLRPRFRRALPQTALCRRSARRSDAGRRSDHRGRQKRTGTAATKIRSGTLIGGILVSRLFRSAIILISAIVLAIFRLASIWLMSPAKHADKNIQTYSAR